ncbi:hypothetical protein KOR34_25630 [Posidoniimonas corsicana]|uniref:Uncharacterized protein n=1 Tax=Posidoniimonas corsicana TaxID=1938618 RepID=A0A5C5VIB0_9BACT|nr:hypothetical protein KOR34_25630 [Posidoniimonas corsicana]
MGNAQAGWKSRARAAATRWSQLRQEECTTCRGCGQRVMPLDQYCNHCGQSDPAKVSLSAAVCVVLVIGLLAITGTTAAMAFS